MNKLELKANFLNDILAVIMSVREMQQGIGAVPPDPDQGRIDLDKLREMAERDRPLRTRFGREGNSYTVRPRGGIIKPQETPIRLGDTPRRVF